jgi:hypothetical protein
MQTEGRAANPKNVSRTHVIHEPKGNRTKRTPFRDHYLEMMTEAKELGLSGATDFEIAQHFGVPQLTLDYWKRRVPEFAAALRAARDIADEKVAASLYHKARGYTFQSEEIKVVDGAIIRVPTTTHVAPDTTAMIFWLKNRQREQWRDQQDVSVSGAIDLKSADLRAFALSLLATIQAGLATPAIIEHESTSETQSE